jgi:glycosyltransferase involved in cell wall biosynthesis
VNSKPLSVLLVGDYPPDRTLGSSKVFYKLREEFQAFGHHCDIVFGDEIAAPHSRQIRQVVSPWSAASSIIRHMNRQRYDVIDAASAEGLWIGMLKKIGGYGDVAVIARSNGLEHLNYGRMIEDHRAGLNRKGWARRIWYPLTRLSQVAAAARAADRLLLLNEIDRRYAIDRGWKTEDEIDVVPHGVSPRFLANPVSEQRRGKGLLFCGSWDNSKGVPYVVRTFERLHERGRRLNLTVLGPGVSDDLVLDAFSPAARPFVHVIARVPEEDVIEMYRTHDVLLWLPTYEGFGLALLEAMSQALAAVATPVGCAPSIVRNGVNGLIVPRRDPDAAVAAVERLMDSPELRRSLGESARHAVAGMTWAEAARQTLEVYTRARKAFAS